MDISTDPNDDNVSVMPTPPSAPTYTLPAMDFSPRTLIACPSTWLLAGVLLTWFFTHHFLKKGSHGE